MQLFLFSDIIIFGPLNLIIIDQSITFFTNSATRKIGTIPSTIDYMVIIIISLTSQNNPAHPLTTKGAACRLCST